MSGNLKLIKGESVKNLEYHKGTFCIYTSIFCQEGYCSQCEIFLRRRVPANPTGQHNGTRVVKRSAGIRS